MIAALLAVLAAQATPTREDIYKKTPQGDLKLQLYLPADWKPADKRPAIVFFFGGGWTSGSPQQFSEQAAHLARRGMVAACADYRVKSRHQVTPDACVEDAKSAVRWLRKNAATLGVDPDRIVASGGSAGGHIAACTGTVPGGDAKDEDPAVSSKPNAMVLFNPVLHAAPLVSRMGSEEAAKKITPNEFLTKDLPPALILFGTSDALIEGAKVYVEKAKELGAKAELYTAEGQPHGFFNRAPWKEKTTQRMDEFLVSLGYLAPER